MGTEANDKSKEEEKAKALAGDPTVKSEDMKDAAIGSETSYGKSSENNNETPKKVKYGEHYTKKDGKKALKPNIEYTTDEGYKYTTDSKGRIISAEGVLQRGIAKRNDYAQRNVGKGDGRRDGTEGMGKDDGGHLIASIFKGSGDIDNLVPMDSNLNRGQWKAMENAWASTLEKDKTARIQVKIKPIYEDDTSRPTKFDVKYRINNGKWIKEPFENERRKE